MRHVGRPPSFILHFALFTLHFSLVFPFDSHTALPGIKFHRRPSNLSDLAK